MRFRSPAISISPTARRFALAALALLAFAVGGACEDHHIGRLCDPGVPSNGGMSGGGTVATISSPALECPSRICLLPAGDTGNPTGTGALCTAGCENNDDCEGETGSAGETKGQCESGFVCMWPVNAGPF